MEEIQKGLLLETTVRTVRGKVLVFRKLHAVNGYCFYSKRQKYEIDNWSNLDDKPALEYMTFASLGIHDDINNYVSVPVQDNFEKV